MAVGSRKREGTMGGKITLPNLAMDEAVRKALSKAIRNCPKKSRATIADELSAAVKSPITARSLDNYTAESRPGYRFPAVWLIPFCNIVGDFSLLREVLGPQLARVLSLGEKQVEALKETAALLAELQQDEPKSRR